jgi:hypothetical protein
LAQNTFVRINLVGDFHVRKLFRLGAAAFGTGVLCLGVALPAQAHDLRLYLDECNVGQRCGYGQVRDNHEIIDACDTRSDGLGLSTRYRLLDGTEGSVGDGNGAAAGCGVRRVGTYGSNPIVAIKVCVHKAIQDACVGWKIA